MPTRDDLQAVIDTDGLTPDSARELNQLAQQLFSDQPTLPYLVARAVFRDLSDAWDDPQAVPSSGYTNAQNILLPRLRVWMQSDATFSDATEMQKVAQALRDALA